MDEHIVEQETEPNEVVRSIDLPATPAQVWEAIVDDDLLGTWLGGDAEIDARPGGAIRLDDGTEVRTGAIDTFEREVRISFIWYVDEAEPTEVIMDIEPHDGHTTLRVVERPFVWEFDTADQAWIGGGSDAWLVASAR